MTWDEFISQQEQFLQEIVSEGQAFGVAVSGTHADVSKRIFVEGMASNGEPIGEYSDDKPIYVNPNASPVKFTPEGKPGSRVNKQNRRTKYFASYKAFRGAIGRENAFVNLRLTNILQNDFNTGLVQISAVKWEAIVKNKVNADKVEGNEGRFKKPIFATTQAEQAKLAERFDFELQKRINAMA
jgi:hypothetical protein